ncbi:hypothetical protein [Actinomadura rupiterrae]|uniref:hypothetical protein n=1 Tax=Actinomadura rupiterrae TaxID=559627 RepID=UPI0020A59DBE|nr:hypothetical protein [Actinomadura rupiterrae]MCP2335639.1 hypothetical protein [Actinomadura rupiterrae]
MVHHKSPLFDDLRKRSRDEGKAEGKAEAQREMLLNLFAHRKFCVSEQVRRRVLACEDSETMNLWLMRAADASSIDEVFADE